MMNFSERRIHSAKILFATRYSLFAAVLPFVVHYSLLAIRYSPPFPDLPICRFHDLPISFGSAGISPSHDVAD